MDHIAGAEHGNPTPWTEGERLKQISVTTVLPRADPAVAHPDLPAHFNRNAIPSA